MRIAIQGEPGSFSHEAALNLEPEATIVPCSLSADVFRRMENEEVEAAVIPIENSLAGSVVEHFDLLFQHDVQIERESLLRIRHNLIGIPGSKINDMDRVYSHPVALAQCRRFLTDHPQMVPTPFYDTAGSVKRLIELGDARAGAIASGRAALYYGGEVLAEDIEDNPANFTRFFFIRRRVSSQPQANFNKVSIAFTLENCPGALVSALQIFAEHHTNLSKIESRPVHGAPWRYIFYVDYQISDPEASSVVLAQLRNRCFSVKELGRYRSAPPVL